MADGEVGEAGLDAASTATALPEPPARAPDVPSAEDRFRAGYRDQGGPPELLEHFIHNVLPCESGDGNGGIDWTPGNQNYRTAAQFHPGTMATIEAAIGPIRFEDPYDVGRAVAWWLGAISEPGGTGGWPVCYWRG